MSSFMSDNINIAYEVYGEGKPIVLVHGFASNGVANWLDTGWVETLNLAGYSCVTIDNRGHGLSEKLYEAEKYPARLMAKDVSGLIEYLELGAVPVMGYSMGARISAFAAMDNPQLVNGVIFGGLGINMIRGVGGSNEIVAGLLAPSLDDVQTPTGRKFRAFAEQTGSDLRALAACMQASRDRISENEISHIAAPALIAVGSEDEIGGSPEELAQLLPKGEALVIPRRDHMRATGDRVFKSGVLDFLARLPS